MKRVFSKSLNNKVLRETNKERNTRPYQVCARCIMDTTDPLIQFDEKGFCEHCRRYFEREKSELFRGEEGRDRLSAVLKKIKADGDGKPYDCIIGVSGGVDSTMVAYKCRKHGLRPLAVHLDNGWDSELAVHNIEKTLKKLNIDLYTLVLDWEEFRDIQLSFLKASVANAEIPTDHAITALLFKTAAEKGVKYIISGSNLETEGIMPINWMYDNRDFKHLNAIHKKYGTKPLKTYPFFKLHHFLYYVFLKKISFVKLLNYEAFDKAQAMKLLQNELGWVYYGGKHYESVYTRFFQGYYLPQKFGIDKRRAHLSTMICSGQTSRDEALREMEKPVYPVEMFQEDKIFVMKKFGLTERDFNELMESPIKNHFDYPSNQFIFSENKFGLREWAKKMVVRT